MNRILRIMIVVASLSMAFATEARNLFVPGTQWIERTTDMGSGNATYSRSVLGDEIVIDGETVMPFYFLSLDEDVNPLSAPFVYIRTEGEKVYFQETVI